MTFDSSEAEVGRLTPETFDPLVSQMFEVVTRSRPADVVSYPDPDGYDDIPLDRVGTEQVELVDVKRYPELEEAEGGFDHREREPFSLLFRGEHDCNLWSSMHEFRHEAIGSLMLFLTPVAVHERVKEKGQKPRRYYEVMFG